MVEAIIRLDETFQKRITLDFIGPGVLQQKLKQKVSDLNLQDRIRFHGEQPKEFIAQKMREVDLLVHPTEIGTFGVVVAEALSNGVPCLVSDVPALLVDESSGFLVKENTVEAWKDHLKNILFKGLNFNRLEIAPKNRDRFSYNAIGKSYLKAYAQTLTDR